MYRSSSSSRWLLLGLSALVLLNVGIASANEDWEVPLPDDDYLDASGRELTSSGRTGFPYGNCAANQGTPYNLTYQGSTLISDPHYPGVVEHCFKVAERTCNPNRPAPNCCKTMAEDFFRIEVEINSACKNSIVSVSFNGKIYRAPGAQAPTYLLATHEATDYFRITQLHLNKASAIGKDFCFRSAAPCETLDKLAISGHRLKATITDNPAKSGTRCCPVQLIGPLSPPPPTPSPSPSPPPSNTTSPTPSPSPSPTPPVSCAVPVVVSCQSPVVCVPGASIPVTSVCNVTRGNATLSVGSGLSNITCPLAGTGASSTTYHVLAIGQGSSTGCHVITQVVLVPNEICKKPFTVTCPANFTCPASPSPATVNIASLGCVASPPATANFSGTVQCKANAGKVTVTFPVEGTGANDGCSATGSITLITPDTCHPPPSLGCPTITNCTEGQTVQFASICSVLNGTGSFVPANFICPSVSTGSVIQTITFVGNLSSAPCNATEQVKFNIVQCPGPFNLVFKSSGVVQCAPNSTVTFDNFFNVQTVDNTNPTNSLTFTFPNSLGVSLQPVNATCPASGHALLVEVTTVSSATSFYRNCVDTKQINLKGQ